MWRGYKLNGFAEIGKADFYSCFLADFG